MRWHEKGILWTGAVICSSTCVAGVYTRYKPFRRLPLDDWMMLLVLGMLLSVVILGQVYFKDVYILMAVSKGEMTPDPTFVSDAQRGLRAFGVTMLFSYLGILATKLKYLWFFRRLIIKMTSHLLSYFFFLVGCAHHYHCMRSVQNRADAISLRFWSCELHADHMSSVSNFEGDLPCLPNIRFYGSGRGSFKCVNRYSAIPLNEH